MWFTSMFQRKEHQNSKFKRTHGQHWLCLPITRGVNQREIQGSIHFLFNVFENIFTVLTNVPRIKQNQNIAKIALNSVLFSQLEFHLWKKHKLFTFYFVAYQGSKLWMGFNTINFFSSPTSLWVTKIGTFHKSQSSYTLCYLRTILWTHSNVLLHVFKRKK